MIKITVYDWSPGMQKIGFTKFLQNNFGYGLRDAKQKTDNVLAGEAVSIIVSDLSKLPDILKQLDSLAVKYVVSTVK